MSRCPGCPDARYHNGYGCDLCGGSGIKSEVPDPRPSRDPCLDCTGLLPESYRCEFC